MLKTQVMAGIGTFAVVVLMITMIEDILQYRRGRRVSKVFIRFQAFTVAMLVANTFHLYFIYRIPDAGSEQKLLVILSDILMFVFYYTAQFCFVCYVQEFIENRQRVSPVYRRVAMGICIVNGLLWGISTVNGMIMVSRGEELAIGPLDYVGKIGGYAFVLFVAVMVWQHRRALSAGNILVLMSFVILPLIGAAIRTLFHLPALVQIAMALSILLMHVSVFHETAEMIRSQEIQLTRARIRIMRSQIGPHFLFNTLNAIYVLCEKDPVQAQQAVSDFSEYLRANLDVLENDARIPFTREMEHVSHYLRLEKMRFRDELHVEQDLEVMNFVLPTLTIQPIVENAVNHGIGRKKGGGTVSIRSRETEDAFWVIVQDDGVGFDPAILEATETEQDSSGESVQNQEEQPRTHIGLKNVRERLAFMSEGTLTVESRPGEGTSVQLRIPKDKNAMFSQTVRESGRYNHRV